MSLSTVSRYLVDPPQSYFLFGPRGTGKTTWLEGQYPEAFFINLLDPEMAMRLQAHPGRLRDLVIGNLDGKGVVVIDEIQKAPDCLAVVHQLIYEHPELKFILTGSSARKLKRSGVDLLGGRALIRNCHPFMASELGKEFNLSNTLELGTLPVVLGANSPEETLRSYVSIYVREEVNMESLVRNAGAFARFLEIASFSQGSYVNAAEIARECHIDARTVITYMSILKDMLLAFDVPVFSKRAKRHLTQRAKFYLFDCGVFRSLRPKGPLDRTEELDGAALETLIGQHLRAFCDYSGTDQSLYHWRTKAGLEVDFVIYGPENFAAIEVKNTRRPTRRRDLKGLKHFRQDYPEAELFLLHRGPDITLEDGILCLPCDVFLKCLKPRQLLTHQSMRKGNRSPS